MDNLLRDRRTAAEWAALGQAIEFHEKISGFEQLASIVRGDLAALEADKMPPDWADSVVAGALEFGFADAQRSVPTVRCAATVTVDAICQRCLEAFRLPLETEAELLLLEPQETAQWYEDREVWELDGKTLRPRDIVEELLIMALPFSAMHVDSASCSALLASADNSEELKTPFAALRAQMIQDK